MRAPRDSDFLQWAHTVQINTCQTNAQSLHLIDIKEERYEGKDVSVAGRSPQYQISKRTAHVFQMVLVECLHTDLLLTDVIQQLHIYRAAYVTVIHLWFHQAFFFQTLCFALEALLL